MKKRTGAVVVLGWLLACAAGPASAAEATVEQATAACLTHAQASAMAPALAQARCACIAEVLRQEAVPATVLGEITLEFAYLWRSLQRYPDANARIEATCPQP